MDDPWSENKPPNYSVVVLVCLAVALVLVVVQLLPALLGVTP